MKRILFFSTLFLVSLYSWSQSEETTKETKNNEIHFNAFNLVVFKKFDISYERNLSKISSVGITLLKQLGDENAGYNGYDSPSFSLTPYYRHFFSKNYSQGFFMEAFTTFNSGEVRENHYEDYHSYSTYEKYTDVAIGISLGGKLVSTNGFIGEIHAGIGRNILSEFAPEFIGRGSISFGYRF